MDPRYQQYPPQNGYYNPNQHPPPVQPQPHPGYGYPQQQPYPSSPLSSIPSQAFHSSPQYVQPQQVVMTQGPTPYAQYQAPQYHGSPASGYHPQRAPAPPAQIQQVPKPASTQNIPPVGQQDRSYERQQQQQQQQHIQQQPRPQIQQPRHQQQQQHPQPSQQSQQSQQRPQHQSQQRPQQHGQQINQQPQQRPQQSQQSPQLQQLQQPRPQQPRPQHGQHQGSQHGKQHGQQHGKPHGQQHSKPHSQQHGKPHGQQHGQQQRPQQRPQPYPQTMSKTSTPVPTPPKSSTPNPNAAKNHDSSTEYQLLLLSLGEEYITAAHSLGPMVSLMRRNGELEQYHQLMATGLGCMEAVLKKFRLHPRMEATLTLRYATLLHEETENTEELEAILGKGIALCERNKLLDLKYSMQHLLARVLARTNLRAATKQLDSVISEVEAYQRVAWVYALKFLRVTLALQKSSHSELLVAIQNLRAILELSQSIGDRAVFVTAATLEALVHLRTASSDSIEQAQRAIASARSLQLQMKSKEFTQVNALLNCVDLACTLQQSAPKEAEAKLSALQTLVDEANDSNVWKNDGTFYIPIEASSGGQLTASTGGIFERNPQTGKDKLVFSWLPGRDLYMLAYYLSGVTVQLCGKEKAEIYLNQGLKAASDNLAVPDVRTAAVRSASDRAKWQTLVRWHMQLQLCFIYSSRSDWDSARKWLQQMKTSLEENPIMEVSESLTRWTTYLSGVIEQGTGNSETALAIYQSPIFTHPSNSASRPTDPHVDVCTLAALNTLMILREPGHPQQHLIESLLDRIEPLCLNHPNKSLRGAFWIVKTVALKSPMLKIKEFLQHALSTGKVVSNQQIMALTLNLMCRLFFANIVGEQAEKSARAAKALAERAKSTLWTTVADGMLSNTLEKIGKGDEAGRVKNEGMKLMQSLPPKIQESCIDTPLS